MADIFIEHMVVKRKTAADMAIAALYIFAYVLINFTFFVLLFALLPASLAGGGWLLMILLRSRNVEYEYIVTNGIVDVDKITGKRKRKRLISLDCRNFEILAPMSGDNFNQYENTKFVSKLDASSGADVPERYFAVCPSKEGGGKMLLIFEPNGKMMDAFKIYISRAIRP